MKPDSLFLGSRNKTSLSTCLPGKKIPCNENHYNFMQLVNTVDPRSRIQTLAERCQIHSKSIRFCV